MGRIRKIACGAASSAAMGLLFIATPSIAQTRPPIMGKPIQRPAAVNPLSLITNSLSCDNGQTKHKELKSGVAIHVTPAQIFANGNGLLASIHRTFFSRILAIHPHRKGAIAYIRTTRTAISTKYYFQ